MYNGSKYSERHGVHHGVLSLLLLLLSISGLIYPRLSDIRDISTQVAVEVIKAAAAEDLVRDRSCRERLYQGHDRLLQWVRGMMYLPVYSSLVELPRGVQE